MPNFGYHLARAKGATVRAIYASHLPAIVRRPVQARQSCPLEVFAYSGESALPEQIASIRSFIRHAGRPELFTIVSDGTYSERSLELLRQVDPVVVVSQIDDWIPADLPSPLSTYLRTHPTGKQLAVIMSLPVKRPALYIDSDVLFFRGANAVTQQAIRGDTPALYLPDCQLAADARLFREPSERNRPVNTGVLFLFRPLDWSLSLKRFLELEGSPTFFTNQTMAHLTMHANGAGPLDTRAFVLQLDDQFIYEDRHNGEDLALRHYVNPVRHKFWTSLIGSRW